MEAGARHQHSPVGTDGCWCLAPLMKHTAVRQMLGRFDVDNVQVAWRTNAAQERCICSPSQMAAFDEGDGRGTGRAGGRHPSTVPSHLVSAQSAVSTTSSTHPGAGGRIRWNAAPALDSHRFTRFERLVRNPVSANVRRALAAERQAELSSSPADLF